ncbi:helix-turn-helix domain-containing protein [Dactylosporangium sp. CA-139066]|uniref:helix-turn-helix domain-containing protein n=1 Tax=Dactylosporangium sp. CA-139066 TaxID=3239930 RepID=UPI003D91FDA6
MSTGDSPAGAQRRLRLALRKAREAAGRTQSDIAEALTWSLSKVQRIESGDVRISITDLDALLRHLEVRDAKQVERMVADARLARQRGWWDQPQYREHLTPGLLQIIQLEQDADAIRVFQPVLFPSLLQHEAYMDAILRSVTWAMPEPTRQVRLETRIRRRESVWSRADPPQYLVVLDELMLLRELGGLSVIVRQFETVLEMVRRPEITVRLLPKDQAQYMLLGAFTIFDLGEEENAALYREFSVTDDVVHNAAEVGKYRLRFEQMWNLCLTPEATIAAIEAQYAVRRSDLSRRG